MSFSLAECLLGRYRPYPKREAHSESTPFQGLVEGAEPESPSGYSAQVSELRHLLREIAGGWSELVTSIQELKDALQPEDLRTTLEALGLDESVLRAKPAALGLSTSEGAKVHRTTAANSASHEREGHSSDSEVESDEAQERLEAMLKLVREKLSSIETEAHNSTLARDSENSERPNHAT